MRRVIRLELAKIRKKAFLRRSPFDVIDAWGIPAPCSRRNDAWGDPDAVFNLSVVSHHFEILQIRGWSRIPMRYRLEKKMEYLVKGGVPNPTPEPLTVFQDSSGFRDRARIVEKSCFEKDWCRQRNGEWWRKIGNVEFRYLCIIDKYDCSPMIICGLLDDVGSYRVPLGRFLEVDTVDFLWFRDLDDFSVRYEKVASLFRILVDELVPFTSSS